jgi:hypothetical protein
MTKSLLQRSKYHHYLSLGMLVMSLLCAAWNSAAETLHAIIVADTKSEGAKSAEKDKANFRQLVANVSEATGLLLKETVMDGTKYFVPGSGVEIKRTVEGLSVKPTDIVIFYYTGHGVNTEKGSRWPALDVEGQDTPPDKLLEFSWIRDTLQQKSPRLLMVIADACNEFLSEIRGEGTILGEVGIYKPAYRQLFLGYQGTIVATGAIGEQKAFYNENGGRFTQQFLSSLKEELKSADPAWQQIKTEAEKPITVNLPPEATAQGNKQNPLIEVTVTKVALPEGEATPGLDDNQVLVPYCKMDGDSSTTEGCYWSSDSKEGRRWSFMAEEKLWFSRWHGWYFVPGDPGHYIGDTSEREMVHLITLSGRYEKFSLGLTVSPEHSYGFGKISNLFPYADLNAEYQSYHPAERKEMDINLGYSMLPELQIGIGFKKMVLDYSILDGKYTGSTQTTNRRLPRYSIYGPTLNIGAQVCLKNLIGANMSLFGTFSYGFLKTKWGDHNKNPTGYHSTEVGLSWGLPWKWKQETLELQFGYRAQTSYTETSLELGDAMDSTEGFTLGLRLVY